MIINNSSWKYTTTSASPNNEEAKHKSEKERPTKREKESRARISAKSSLSRSQSASSIKSAGTSRDPRVADQPELIQDPSHATVKGDQTPVYSVNSKDSSVVKLLNKGDWVSTDLDVIDVKGRWTIVKQSDLSKPGFVQPENLQPAKAIRKNDK